MTVTDAAARDWPPPSDEDGIAPGAPRPKRSRLVLGELIGLPIAIALWVVVMDRIHGLGYRPPPTPPADFPITTFFIEVRQEDLSAWWQFITLTFYGLASGLAVMAAISILFGLVRRIPRTSRWVASILVGAWLIVAVYLCFALDAQMIRLTEQAGG